MNMRGGHYHMDGHRSLKALLPVLKLLFASHIHPKLKDIMAKAIRDMYGATGHVHIDLA